MSGVGFDFCTSYGFPLYGIPHPQKKPPSLPTSGIDADRVRTYGLT